MDIQFIFTVGEFHYNCCIIALLSKTFLFRLQALWCNFAVPQNKKGTQIKNLVFEKQVFV